MTRWLKNESDDVDADEPLLEASTDKVDTEVPSPVTGRVLSIKVKEDQTVEVGVELALIGEPSEVAAGAEASQNAPDTATDTAPGVTAPTVGSEAAGAFLTPLVRRLASEHGVDLSVIRGSGAGGRIRKSDVLAAAVPFTATPEVLAAASATSVLTSAPSTPPTPSEPAAAQVAATAAEPVPAVASEVAAGRAAAGRQAVPSDAAPPGVVVQRGRVVPMSRMHQVIARMVESLQTSA